jgi:sec-independent protein translocase protein TatB
MFDVGWSELMLIGVVALVVVGPKDLPRLMRQAGQWSTKAKDMARQFRSGFDTMVQEAELDDMREQARKAAMAVTDPMASVRDAIEGATTSIPSDRPSLGPPSLGPPSLGNDTKVP